MNSSTWYRSGGRENSIFFRSQFEMYVSAYTKLPGVKAERKERKVRSMWRYTN